MNKLRNVFLIFLVSVLTGCGNTESNEKALKALTADFPIEYGESNLLHHKDHYPKYGQGGVRIEIHKIENAISINNRCSEHEEYRYSERVKLNIHKEEFSQYMDLDQPACTKAVGSANFYVREDLLLVKIHSD